jgi:hypothetical protein
MLKTIKQLFVAVSLFAGSPFAQCSVPGTLHVITGNFSAELYGTVDTRPGTWGHAEYAVCNQSFTNVPAGCQVQISHISGDLIACPWGAAPSGTSAGVLVAFVRWYRLDPCGLCGSGVFPLLPGRDNEECDSDSVRPNNSTDCGGENSGWRNSGHSATRGRHQPPTAFNGPMRSRKGRGSGGGSGSR